jgi:hypothetical protein
MAEAGHGSNDDRILPFTRFVALVVIGILVTAWVILFLWPEQTDRRFAWTIEPTMTPMLMGAGYGSAAYFYARVLFGRRWHLVSLGFLPTTLFTWMLLAATFLHWDRFHHGEFPFYLWLWVYIVTPFLVPGVWLLNRRYDPGRPDPDDPPFPAWVLLGLRVAGAFLLAIAAWLFVFPEAAIDAWPWMLTPLTARTVAAFVALPGVAWLVIATDGRWSAARAMVETVALGLVFLVIAVVRAWDQFDTGNPLTWAYVGGLVGTLVAIAAGYGWMESRRRRVAASR